MEPNRLETESLIRYMERPEYAAYCAYAFDRLAEIHRTQALYGDPVSEDGRIAMAMHAQLFQTFNGFGTALLEDLKSRKDALSDE